MKKIGVILSVLLLGLSTFAFTPSASALTYKSTSSFKKTSKVFSSNGGCVKFSMPNDENHSATFQIWEQDDFPNRDDLVTWGNPLRSTFYLAPGRSFQLCNMSRYKDFGAAEFFLVKKSNTSYTTTIDFYD
ncbi:MULTISPECIES: hypothetical protein [Bacillus]|uniref:hypothetical protein n=2 Tax=Bacillaceae TaxID=186817 RepID=UPI000557C858|nr:MULTISPECIES: hypothetical protein [Bacillus]MBW7636507.1 hypothetical protein [Bacillus licheniformis]QOY57487.1 hypothetical protein [Bacillus licheniformis]